MKPELEKIALTLEQLDLENKTAITSDYNPSFRLSQTSKSESSATKPQSSPNQENSIQLPPSPKSKAALIREKSRKPEPSLAMNLLRDLEKTILKWQKDFQEVRLQIQEIYLEGPIINGWLESFVSKPENSPSGKGKKNHSTDETATIVPKTGYRLCGRDEKGKLWFQPCPDDQVPDVSIAIARYQRLRQLLKRKQAIETRLNQIAADLAIIHQDVNTKY
jgi:hypothetical protein